MMVDAAESRKLEKLIKANGFKNVLRELQMIAFAHIGNGNPNWDTYYRELGSLLHKLETTPQEQET